MDKLREVSLRIEQRIAILAGRINNAQACGRKGVLEENLGLLGSAEKRLAEVYFKLWRVEGSGAYRNTQMQALTRSHAYYRKSFRHGLSNHWGGVQMLSLEAVTTGRIGEQKLWYAAVAAAEIALEEGDGYWAAGSLLELHLLAGHAGLPFSLDATKEQVRVFVALVPATPDGAAKIPFPIELTLRQLGRYCDWWTLPNGFFPRSVRFTLQKGQGRSALQRLQIAPAPSSPEFVPLACLHQHHRECHGHGAQGLPQRQILALALDGAAMGRSRHARSCPGLPSIEGIQASASSSRCSCKARPTAAFRPGACSNRRGCVNLNAQRPLREFQQTAGHPPEKIVKDSPHASNASIGT